MKYRTQSAEVLNEADALERKLDWMLFKSEQESILYGGGENEWRPGDSLVHEMYVQDSANLPDDYAFWDGVRGNYTRPLIEVYQGHDDTMDSVQVMRCEDCQVWFGRGENECFVCYKQVEPLPDPIQPKFMEYGYGLDFAQLYLTPNASRRIGTVDEVVETPDGVVAHGRMDDITVFEDYDIDFNRVRFMAEARIDGVRVSTRHYVDRDDLIDVSSASDVTAWLRQEMRQMLNEEWRRAISGRMEPIAESARRAGRTIQGMHTHFSFIDEMFGRPEPTVVQQAEETESCSDIDFTFDVESLYVESPTTTPPFVLPHDIDLSGQRAITPPVIVVGSSGQVVGTTNNHPMSTPITERRRQR